MDAGWLHVPKVRDQIEAALEPFHFPKPAISEIGGTGVYFTPGTYDKLKSNPAAMGAVHNAILHVPGVAAVYSAEELESLSSSKSSMEISETDSFFPRRSGDLFLVPRPYWLWDYTEPGTPRDYGATHGHPYPYDQRVPVLFMGYGIHAGEYYEAATPADMAPTLAALCGITLVAPDGHVLAQALKTPAPALAPSRNPVLRPASAHRPSSRP
jgi:hypothetical protein